MQKLERALFPASEATACGFTRSELENLIRAGIAPAPLQPAVRGGKPLWSTSGIAELATMGAVFAGLPSLLLAGRLAARIYREHLAEHGWTPSGLVEFDYIAPIGPRLKGPNRYDEHGETDHWLRFLNAREYSDAVRDGRAALRRPSDSPGKLYLPGVARDRDTRFGIADGRHVFALSWTPYVQQYCEERSRLAPKHLISGWKRGASPDDIRVESFFDFLPIGWDEDQGPDSPYALLHAEWLAAWDNATSRIEINVSLAIRNAFDRIYEIRRSKQ